MPQKQELRLPESFLERMKLLLKEEYPLFLESYHQPRTFGIRTNTLKIRPEELEKILPLKLESIAGVPGGFLYTEEDSEIADLVDSGNSEQNPLPYNQPDQEPSLSYRPGQEPTLSYRPDQEPTLSYRPGQEPTLSYRPGQDPLYHAGLFYLQEPSAMLPASVLPVIPGDLVLDLCAAPGGKATAIAAKLEGKGFLLANEISASRIKALQKNLEIFGVTNACITNEVPAHMADFFPGFFDKIIVDAPCSGEGMFRKDPGSARVWSEDKVRECAKIQKGLVTLAASMLRPGGQMVYSTCTFSPEENEQVIWHLLKTCPEMELCEIPIQEGFAPGRPDWLESLDADIANDPKLTESGIPGDSNPIGSDPMDKNSEDSHQWLSCECISRCVRIFPHRGFGEGHFLALLRKKENHETKDAAAVFRAEEPVNFYRENQKKKKEKVNKRNQGKNRPDGGFCLISREEREALERFFEGGFFPWDFSRIRSRGGNLTLIPEVLFPQERVRTVSSGLYLGEVRRGRFEPSQALAMALSKESYPSFLDFPRDDPRLIRYFRGETIDTSEKRPAREQGWQLICTEGWPVGWGKRTGMMLKNKLHPGWRF